MQLETINKLFLELSQVATAKTSREIRLKAMVDEQMDLRILIRDICNCAEVEALPVDIRNRILDVMDGKKVEPQGEA